MNKILMAICLIPLSGCVTKVLQEPDRTALYVNCLQSARTLTTCECIEKKTVDNTGLTVLITPEDAQKFLAELREIVQSGVCDPSVDNQQKE